MKMSKQQEEITARTSHYFSDDIFNTDETGLCVESYEAGLLHFKANQTLALKKIKVNNRNN